NQKIQIDRRRPRQRDAIGLPCRCDTSDLLDKLNAATAIAGHDDLGIVVLVTGAEIQAHRAAVQRGNSAERIEYPSVKRERRGTAVHVDSKLKRVLLIVGAAQRVAAGD